MKVEARMQWKEMKNKGCCTDFRERLRQAPSGSKHDWNSTAIG